MSLGTALLGLGLVITCLAGFRVLLLVVDLFTGSRPRGAPQFADRLLIGISIGGLALLLLGGLLLRAAATAR